ncbi:extracellular solute-binding protein [Aquabacterium sp.]|uniref:extracellular solute-binding protein n=1 Tax=Aquabacterium sp. TaxID=1872578 RepID=UPI002BC8594A|nr:extracellular solute-binding protein [Aquabacterium sp.]HSW03515.1 extracellular solute-binding protein [Aquabacterium sp.]
MSAALSAQAQKLVVWMVGDDKVVRVLQPAVEAFKAKRPGVQVEVRDVPWADAMSKYSAALASRSGPDVITGGTTFGIDLGAKGALIDLNQRAPDLVKLLEQHAAPGAIRSVRRPDGVMHAAPFDMHVQLQYYRTDLLPKAPATYAEFDAEVRRLRAGGARGYAQQWGNTSWLGFFPYLLQAGGALYDAQCTKALVDSPEAVRALNYYATIYRQLKAPTDTWPDADGGLENGSYPLIQSGTWQLSSLDITRRKIAGRWAAAPLPAAPGGRNTAFIGGTVMGVTSFSPNVDLALDFLRTVYQADVTRRMGEAALPLGLVWLPGGRTDQLAALPLPPQHKQVLMAQLKDTEGPPNCPGWQRLSESLTRAVQRVVLADGDAQQELSKAAEKMNRALVGGR